MNPFAHNNDNDENYDDTTEQQNLLATRPPFLHGQNETVKSNVDLNPTNRPYIVDLDEFFTRVYDYHRRKGFWCIVVEDSFELLRFTFVALFLIFLCTCVDYQILFRDKLVAHAGGNQSSYKVTLNDAIRFDASKIDFFLVLCCLVAVSFWIYWFMVLLWKIMRNLSTKKFYAETLNLDDSALENLKWSDVSNALLIAQRRHQFCMNKIDLTEMDVSHQILRRKNYLVAMTNKNLLPVRFRAPFLGEVTYFTNGFKFNFEFLFFLGWYSPWKDYWRLKDEYKNAEFLDALSQRTEKVVFWLALLNLLLSPVIFVWQIFYSLFSYGELIKREPGLLGTRRWSIYGKYFLRHFNELDHELDYRLNLAYQPSCQYIDMFRSDMLNILAKNLIFFLGAPTLVLLALSIYDEDVLQVQHVLTIITVFGLIIALCKSLMSNENQIVCPELMLKILANHLCYIPDHWRGQAHTSSVRREFSQLFQYTSCFVLEELFSPLITPFVLLFWLRPRCRQILDFFRKFTIEVPSLGDVCSFAMLDVRKHGDKTWRADGEQRHPFDRFESREEGGVGDSSSAFCSANHGKTELSLIRFQTANRCWRPTQPSSRRFLTSLRARCEQDAAAIVDDGVNYSQEAADANALLRSLASLPSPYYAAALMTSPTLVAADRGVDAGGLALASLRRAATRDHRLTSSTSIGFDRYLRTSDLFDSQLTRNVLLDGSAANRSAIERFVADDDSMDMMLTTAYLRELHNRRVRPSIVRSYGSTQFSSPPAARSSTGRGDRFAAVANVPNTLPNARQAVVELDSLVPLGSPADPSGVDSAAGGTSDENRDLLWNVPAHQIDRDAEDHGDSDEGANGGDLAHNLDMPPLHFDV